MCIRDRDYPRDMSMWKGIGYNIDTAFQWKDGKHPLLSSIFTNTKTLIIYNKDQLIMVFKSILLIKIRVYR